MIKKGASFTGWIEAGLLGTLLIMCFVIMTGGLDSSYKQSHEIPLVGNTTKWTVLQDSLQTQSEQGEVQFSSYTGITLKSSWAMIQLLSATIWGVITGGWVYTLVILLHLPTIVATVLQSLYFLSVILILLYIVTRVKA